MNTEYKGPPRFVFLEFLEEEINCVLHGLRKEFNSSDADSDIHITVRGPYYSQIPQSELDKCQSKLERDPILLDGFGIFENKDESVVYMKVSSPHLEEIWWKPDYPIEKYGFNPHISLYKGQDKALAHEILGFLKQQNLKLLSRRFRLTPFASKQGELFPQPKVPKAKQFLNLANLGLVQPNILQKAENMVRAFRANNASKRVDSSV